MRKNTSHFWLAFLFFVFTPLLSFGESTGNKVSLFVTLSPAGSFTATSESVKGDLIKTKTGFKADKITILIETLKTGIGLRDQHLWKHLQSKKHPKIIATQLVAENGTAKATLEVNGIQKPITITYKQKENQVTANFQVNASDFNLPKAEYLGVKVNNLNKITVIFNLDKKAPTQEPPRS